MQVHAAVTRAHILESTGRRCGFDRRSLYRDTSANAGGRRWNVLAAAMKPARTASGAQPPSGTWRSRVGQSYRGAPGARGCVQAAAASTAAVAGSAGTAQGFLGTPILASIGLRALLGVAAAPLAQRAFRRLFGGRRRRARRVPAKMDSSARAVLSIATYNVRGRRQGEAAEGVGSASTLLQRHCMNGHARPPLVPPFNRR